MHRLIPLLSVLFFVPSPADAWVQTTTCIDGAPPAPTTIPFCRGDEVPIPLSWPSAEVRYEVNRTGTDDFPTEDGLIDPRLLQTINDSMATWNEPDCSPFRFVDDGLTDIDSFVDDDGHNVIVFYDDGEWPYASAALACTAVSFRPGEPDIVNADMEINSDLHEFVFVEEGQMDGWDVANTVTHEAGHMLGLAHTPVDGATMEFDASPGETHKRELAQDDVDGLCSVYPAGSDKPDPNDPGKRENDNGCCATAVADTTSGHWLVGLIAFAALWRRRS